ncbi:MAG: HD domain-containing protein [Deltaproteobacteria bacterium]|nr:HD domain-containing protein [Deltaproteobacteria bacterium]PWB63609.1 MAG: phosphohydrolase [Deltaproteobacteria bacterium]
MNLVQDIRINLWDLVTPVAKTLDMMSPAVAEHNLRVAFLALRIGEELPLSAEERREIAIAGALHDIGAFSLSERLDLLDFEETRPMQHSIAGYLLLKDFKPFSRVASLVEFHHLPWNQGEGRTCRGKPVPLGSHLLHLADRVAVLLPKGPEVLEQVDRIMSAILKYKGERFAPECVDAFSRIAGKDYVWLEIASSAMESVLRRDLSFQIAEIDMEGLLELSRLICRIIDFKSAFTATHSSGVAAAGGALSRRAGFSSRECRLLEIAAYLHDLGKLAVPSEILEKPGKLSPREWNIMRTHVYYTYQVLDSIEPLAVIASWGGLHQERLNGSGYPFRYTREQLPLGARILAVADVFTSLAEDRPYRKAMTREEATGVLRGMAGSGELDDLLVDLLIRHYEEADSCRAAAQAKSVREYEEFRSALGGTSAWW